MTPLAPQILDGRVAHVRHGPRRHALRHGLFSVLLDVDGPHSAASAELFSVGRVNLVSFWPGDHGRGDGDLRGWITDEMRQIGVTGPIGRIQILTAPRVFGLVFNPLSVFFVHDPQDRLMGVAFEVSNFHAGRHTYAFAVDEPDARTLRFECPKDFFVSPFNDTNGVYRFRLDRSDDHYRLGIQLFRDGQCVMGAIHDARLAPLTAAHVRKAQLKHPFNTLGIVGAILFEAFRLFAKGLPLNRPRRGTVDTLAWRR